MTCHSAEAGSWGGRVWGESLESLIPSGTSSQACRESQLPDSGTNAKKVMILWQEVELYFTVITYLGFAEISICVLPKCQGPCAPKCKAGKLHGLVSVGETASALQGGCGGNCTVLLGCFQQVKLSGWPSLSCFRLRPLRPVFSHHQGLPLPPLVAPWAGEREQVSCLQDGQ